MQGFNILKPRQNVRDFANDVSKYVFLNETVWISIDISLILFTCGQINNILIWPVLCAGQSRAEAKFGNVDMLIAGMKTPVQVHNPATAQPVSFFN